MKRYGANGHERKETPTMKQQTSNMRPKTSQNQILRSNACQSHLNHMKLDQQHDTQRILLRLHHKTQHKKE